MAKTMKFFERMLTVFFDRQNPDSTSANPRFMKNTRDAVSTHPDRVEGDGQLFGRLRVRVRGKGDGADDHTGHVERPKLA